jgi:hypothetical protein
MASSKRKNFNNPQTARLNKFPRLLNCDNSNRCTFCHTVTTVDSYILEWPHNSINIGVDVCYNIECVKKHEESEDAVRIVINDLLGEHASRTSKNDLIIKLVSLR